MRPWILTETNYAYTQDHPYDVAVLPLGATEPHNLHLPYGTDVLEATIIGEHACEEAHRQGARVVLLPAIPYGTETNLRQFPLAMNLNPSTLYRVVEDLVETLVENGIRKILLLNSHGGNEMKPFLREMYGKSSAHLFLCNWYQAVRDVYSDLFTHSEDHAGEMETSFALAYFPDLVQGTEGHLQADQGEPTPFRFKALEEGWVSITRPWHLLTTNAGSGNPHEATAEKGRRLMELLVTRLAPFLVELSRADIDETFPFDSPSNA
ncbi:MAG: creatininase family protein [Pirellulaceae bacterium]|jgi:creatinine amidohydrolase|nr:creatininase family protein [Planctomycetaceae bacterium]HIM30587.1 creatininase family protein [Planctomycetota bacterium]